MPPQPSLRTLIIDDEPHARRYLRELLSGEEGVVVAGEAADGAEGLHLIRELSPALVFLDIQMPRLNGFELIAQTTVGIAPVCVFVTGYGEYAVKAFEVEAVDYLCKPFGKERLQISLERAARRLSPSVERAEGKRWLSRLAIKDEESITYIPVEQILWVEAANKYVVVYTASRHHIARQTLQALEDSLDPQQFLRIHRSILVSKAAVRGLHPLFHGDYIVKLTNGKELPLSRNFRGEFFDWMSR